MKNGKIGPIVGWGAYNTNTYIQVGFISHLLFPNTFLYNFLKVEPGQLASSIGGRKEYYNNRSF